MITRVLGQQSCHVIDCKYIVANVIKSSREKSNNPIRCRNPTEKIKKIKQLLLTARPSVFAFQLNGLMVDVTDYQNSESVWACKHSVTKGGNYPN